mmetsp:Transcript_13404/g.41701  ORF Transcript_13404/g.41701 Transcript_13404/m.41701 type:complete len:236 (-) Transcript_13404:427-1134(-)
MRRCSSSVRGEKGSHPVTRSVFVCVPSPKATRPTCCRSCSFHSTHRRPPAARDVLRSAASNIATHDGGSRPSEPMFAYTMPPSLAHPSSHCCQSASIVTSAACAVGGWSMPAGTTLGHSGCGISRPKTLGVITRWLRYGARMFDAGRPSFARSASNGADFFHIITVPRREKAKLSICCHHGMSMDSARPSCGMRGSRATAGSCRTSGHSTASGVSVTSAAMMATSTCAKSARITS